ncbi:nuclease-related domain-containing protein [Cytobacillus gottheilii]|uniref:nuclease-related domain-containing protein n=1 Tax=Cytobacillus gottheilii TaxID=859144 RepID=UPI000AD750BC|nr:nuclease-related domain-containing protein [Cytobacillus gottheilii]
MNLPDLKKKHHLEKGYAGEKRFDHWLETELSCSFIVLKDITLDVHSSNALQIDTLLISEKTLYLFEVKNYEGDFSIDGEKWHSITGTEIKSPLQQLKRSELLLNQFCRELGYKIPIESYCVFINPEFHLFGCTPQQPLIFPAQIKRFLQKINNHSTKLKAQHHKLAAALNSYKLEKSPYSRFPAYSYDTLKKGVPCPVCRTFMLPSNSKMVCDQCGFVEKLGAAILRCVQEFKILFPEEKITVAGISNWTGGLTVKTVQRVLKRHYRLTGSGRGSFYV